MVARSKAHKNRTLMRLAKIPPPSANVRMISDHGFGEHELYAMLAEELKFDVAIRFRAIIMVAAASGETRLATDWVSQGSLAQTRCHGVVSIARQPVATVVCVQDKGMAQLWCLAASTGDEAARQLFDLYSRRWSLKCGFRDVKDMRFGMSIGGVEVRWPERRDRLWLLSAFASALLIFIETARETLGYDRDLRTSITSRRTHLLVRRG